MNVPLSESMIASKRTPRVMKLKQETMNSALFSTEVVKLQPLKSPRTVLAEKKDYSNEVIDFNLSNRIGFKPVQIYFQRLY